jgi:hypothetical protein
MGECEAEQSRRSNLIPLRRVCEMQMHPCAEGRGQQASRRSDGEDRASSMKRPSQYSSIESRVTIPIVCVDPMSCGLPPAWIRDTR